MCVCVGVWVCVCAQDSLPFTMSHASASSDADACIVTKVNWSKFKVRSAVSPAPEEADHTSPALPFRRAPRVGPASRCLTPRP